MLLRPLGHRAIQIGLSGVAARHYVQDWTVGIIDVTALAREIHDLVNVGNLAAAEERLPSERPYPLPFILKAVIGAD